MRILPQFLRTSLAVVSISLVAACAKHEAAPTRSTPAKHEHHPPHGGTPVVLGEEIYHLELVRGDDGRLSLYVLDGEMENFVRIAAPSITLNVTLNGATRSLQFNAVANSATGETVGDTSLFEARADWLTTTANFDAVIPRLEIRGTTFTNVSFNFPRGNDRD